MSRPIFGQSPNPLRMSMASTTASPVYVCMDCDDLAVNVPGAGLPDGWVEVHWTPKPGAETRVLYRCGACIVKRRKGQQP